MVKILIASWGTALQTHVNGLRDDVETSHGASLPQLLIFYLNYCNEFTEWASTRD